MSRKLILASTMSLILVGTEAHALGVGALHTQSALNQPFLGQIELTDVRPDELDAVKASIASSEAYVKVGLERSYYLTRLQFTPEVSAQGKPLVRVSSREPIREPYMDLLVEVVWPQGQLVKQYTLLLDPPSLTASRGAPGVRRAAGTGSPGEGFPLGIGPVGSGIGLWALALMHRPEGATVAQTAMAIYRNNQHAFVRGNIHRLIAGETLIVPSRDELFALDATAADREYTAAVRGRAVRRSPLTDVPAYADTAHLRIAGPAPVPTTMPGGSAFGARPAAPGPVPADASSGRAAAPAPGMEKDVLLALETSESTRQETQILRDRIKELETRLSDIQSQLQVRDAELARAQAGVAAPGMLAEARPGAVETTPPAPVEPSSPSAATVPVTPAVPLPEPPTGAEQLPPSVETPAAGFVPVPEPSPATLAPPAAQPDTKPAVTPTRPATTATPVESEPSSSWDSLLLPLAGVAGLTAVGILLFSWVTARRRKREEMDDDTATDSLAIDDPDEPSTVPHFDDKPLVNLEKSGVSAAKGGPDPALNSTTSSNSKADPEGVASPMSMMSSLGNFDAETDEADVLSEADIYLAYGRHSEAEELLRTEMKRAPGRQDVKFKLAEAYAGSRNLTAMADLMRDIEVSGAHQTDPGHWRRLQELFERVRATPENQPVAAAAPLQAARGGAAGDSLLVDSMGLGIDDVLSLDLSEDPRLAADPVKGIGGGDLPSSGNDLLLDLGDAIGAAGLEDSSALFPDLDTGRNPEPVATRAPTRDEPPPLRGPFEDLGDHKAADSELILALEDQNVELVGDLDSIFDTSSPEEDLTLVRDEMIAGRPSGPDRTGPGVPDSVPDSLRSSTEESMSTDLLSSQWQMDSGIWDETATKLDLARAYIEMDDADAAREILQEVMSEGREEQRQEARALLEKMA